MWDCRETNPICRFRIKSTDDLCIGEGTMLIRSLFLDSHLGFFTPDWSRFLRSYTGYPKVWWNLILGNTCTWEYLYTWDVALYLSGKLFLIFLEFVARKSTGSALLQSSILIWHTVYVLLITLWGTWSYFPLFHLRSGCWIHSKELFFLVCLLTWWMHCRWMTCSPRDNF